MNKPLLSIPDTPRRLRRCLWPLTLLAVAACLCPAWASGPVLVHTLEDGARRKSDFAASITILLDEGARYSIEDIIGLPDTAFSRPVEGQTGTAPFAVWAKLILRNSGRAARHEYFSYCSEADSAWAYVVERGVVVDEQYTGQKLQLHDKHLPSMYTYTPISIEGGEEKTVYFKMLFLHPVTYEHFTHLSIQPAAPLVRRLVGEYTWHAFYAGAMWLFCLFSLFLYWVFRERVFLYFASLTFFFGWYFLYQYGVVDGLITNSLGGRNFSLGQGIITGLVLSFFFFVGAYIPVRRSFPRHYRVLFALTALVGLYAHLAQWVGMDTLSLIYSQNMLLAAWVLLTLAPAGLLAARKDPSARVLLVSVGVLVVSIVAYLLSFQNVSPTESWMRHGFQLGTVVFSGILFYGLFHRVNAIRDEKQRVEELNALRSRFFTNISHEFRTPLTLMMGPLRQVMEQAQDPEAKALLGMAHRNAQRQLQLVNQLLDLSKLDAGKMELRASEEDFVPFLKGVVYAYESLAQQKGIRLEAAYPEGPAMLYFNRDKMEKILYNLLSNAFKFTGSGGRISVQLEKGKDRVALTIADTGRGIDPEKLPGIFDRFFQADVNKNDVQEGSGIGLALVHELVQLHGGTIAVDSALDQGTSFTLHFRLGAQHLRHADIIETTAPTAEVAHAQATAWAAPTDPAPQGAEAEGPTDNIPHALLIEDNDDVRAFIRLRLQGSFRLSEATDGEEGIQKALDLVPDLIISDVMMPKKNGYEVCHTLKTDLRTSHIPIILLTAKAAHEEKMEGLETGADDYLTKPFDSQELETRALNLVRLRQQLRERFASAILLKPSEMATSSIDQAFLEEALRIVEARIDDEQFSIEALAEELHMSRPNLNRKLRALVNQSSNQFIQSVRLQRAADLLRQQAGTVSEVAFLTGFSSTAYFVKCFKDHFGETPGNLLKKG